MLPAIELLGAGTAVWFSWGAITKLIDLHFDDGLFHRGVVICTSVLCGLSVGVGMALFTEVFVIYAAIIAGCLLSGKIDNIGFTLSTVVVAGTLMIIEVTAGLDLALSGWHVAAFALLTTGYTLDEVLHEHFIDHDALAQSTNPLARVVHPVLKHRCTSGLFEILVVVVGAISFFGMLGGVVFNVGYYAMHLLGQRLLARASSDVQPPIHQPT